MAQTPAPAPEIRAALPSDAAAIAAIHNQGIEERLATFETHLQRPADAAHRLERGDPLLVAELDREVVAWAGAGPYENHPYYASVGEVTMYVDRDVRRRGIGLALLEALCLEARRRGRHKLLAKIFTSNLPSVALFERAGFEPVGVHRRHGKLDGEWLDVLVCERLLDGS